MTGPYFDNNGRPISKNSVVVVADILGYESEIKRISREEHNRQPFLEFLWDAIQESFPYDERSAGDLCAAKMMTDNLLAAYPVRSNSSGLDELKIACFHIGHFQRKLIQRSLPVRGGVSIGKIHVSDLLVFPTEMVLKEMEQADAPGSPPRIVLMDSAMDFLIESRQSMVKEGNDELEDLLRKDEDSSQFVNYLRPLAKALHKEREDEIIAHKQRVEGGLERFSDCQPICSKYKWMAHYHNEFCRSVPEFNRDEYFVPEMLFSRL